MSSGAIFLSLVTGSVDEVGLDKRGGEGRTGQGSSKASGAGWDAVGLGVSIAPTTIPSRATAY